jgi:hypothetical protein
MCHRKMHLATGRDARTNIATIAVAVATTTVME